MDKIQKKVEPLQIISEIIEYSGLNVAQFLKKIGLNQTFVQDLKNGKTVSISRKTADKIRHYFPEISEQFIILGIRPMINDNSGDIHHNHAGGDILGNGATKTSNDDTTKLIDTVATLTETNKALTEQIIELTRIITQLKYSNL